jgi:hypothetical protein
MKGAGLTQGLLQAVHVEGGLGGTGVQAGIGERLQLGAVVAFYLSMEHAAYCVHASHQAEAFREQLPALKRMNGNTASTILQK